MSTLAPAATTERLRYGFRALLGSTVGRDLGACIERLDRIEAWGEDAATKSDGDLRAWAADLKRRVLSGTPADDLLEEHFAVVREAADRTLGQRPFDEQIVAGMILHEGKVAELQTGEGKTLAAVAPVSLRALDGQGAHVLTVNDYLAERDAAWMRPVYRFLGLSVGFVREGMSPVERQTAYGCDVTYVTAKEAAFDLLRDCLCLDGHDVVHRPLRSALIDEADSILIDEARIPLVIAGRTDAPEVGAEEAAAIAHRFRHGEHFDFSENRRNVFLTDAGVRQAEVLLSVDGLFRAENIRSLADLQNALHAEFLLERDVDYIVRDGRVELVDDFTGRVADRRQWPDGLQGAIEAKEGLELRDEGRILGSVTVQHFIRSYPRVAGMTATAESAAPELEECYGLQVVIVPTHRPCVRTDHPDIVFTHAEAKTAALVDEIATAQRERRPVLVGTGSVVESEALAGRLVEAGVQCRILNAKNDAEEADIVAEAGVPGAVTISTNMAGRGTDIRLGGRDESRRREVVRLGGLYVIGTNRHESVRIDRQLRGRSGRQGDPGSSRFFLSLEDPLVERYGVVDLLPRRRRPERQLEPVADPAVGRVIVHAQRIIEGENQAVRRRLWSYEELIDSQRRYIQDRRRPVLARAAEPDLLARERPVRYAEALLRAGESTLREVERRITLLMIDRCWSDHLAMLRQIRDGIHVVNLVGKDPLAEFFRETGEAFLDLERRIDEEIVATFDRVEITETGVDWEKEGLLGPSSTWTYLVSDNPFGSNTLQNLAHRPGAALFGVFALGPLLFLWGLREHWRKRSANRQLAEEADAADAADAVVSVGRRRSRPRPRRRP